MNKTNAYIDVLTNHPSYPDGYCLMVDENFAEKGIVSSSCSGYRLHITISLTLKKLKNGIEKQMIRKILVCKVN